MHEEIQSKLIKFKQLKRELRQSFTRLHFINYNRIQNDWKEIIMKPSTVAKCKCKQNRFISSHSLTKKGK